MDELLDLEQLVQLSLGHRHATSLPKIEERLCELALVERGSCRSEFARLPSYMIAGRRAQVLPAAQECRLLAFGHRPDADGRQRIGREGL